YLNGIMLISTALNFQALDFATGNELPYILYVPSYTATAWYHKKLPAGLQSLSLQDVLKQSETFASGEYATALMKGNTISDSEAKDIAQKLSRLTGISQGFILEANLRLHLDRFTKELMRSDRLTVGRLDSRFTGRDADAAGEAYSYDPSYAAIQGVFTSNLNSYLRGELKYESDLPYEILTGRVAPWNFGNGSQYLNVSDTLRQAMSENPDLKVYVACGYYDMATPYFAADYVFQHLGLEPALRSHLTMGYFEAGHMMYIQKASLEKLKSELATFMASALPH
ncbi:MAG TPA: peptidase S10, partial [Acidobacteriota bacterium]|nr:peptidase S10 [Acidobacteriota bacterium]